MGTKFEEWADSACGGGGGGLRGLIMGTEECPLTSIILNVKELESF